MGCVLSCVGFFTFFKIIHKNEMAKKEYVNTKEGQPC